MKSFNLKTLFLSLISLLALNISMGQEKLNIAAGLGYPELLNLGIRYQMDQSQMGLSAGFLPDSYNNYFSVGADYFYHFGGLTSLSTRRPWYGRMGLNYYSFKEPYENTKLWLVVPRIGKDFNLSPKMGIAADAGVSLVLSRNGERLEERFFFDEEGTSDVGLSLGFSLFYRL